MKLKLVGFLLILNYDVAFWTTHCVRTGHRSACNR